MFGGIVQKIGRVERLERRNGSFRLAVGAPNFFKGLKTGASIAVHGTCLTAVGHTPSRAVFDVAPETVRRTTLRELQPDSRVHLERALRLGDEIGGHLVQGHVDGRGKVLYLRKRGADIELRLEALVHRCLNTSVPPNSMTKLVSG